MLFGFGFRRSSSGLLTGRTYGSDGLERFLLPRQRSRSFTSVGAPTDCANDDGISSFLRLRQRSHWRPGLFFHIRTRCSFCCAQLLAWGRSPISQLSLACLPNFLPSH